LPITEVSIVTDVVTSFLMTGRPELILTFAEKRKF